MRRTRDLPLGILPGFTGCTAKTLARLHRYMTRVDAPQGAVLLREGAASRECFVIAEGTATVRRADHDIGVLGPGDWVGEIGVARTAVHSASVIAATPVSLFAMTPAEFRAVLELVPVVAHRLEVETSRRRGVVAPAPHPA